MATKALPFMISRLYVVSTASKDLLARLRYNLPCAQIRQFNAEHVQGLGAIVVGINSTVIHDKPLMHGQHWFQWHEALLQIRREFERKSHL